MQRCNIAKLQISSSRHCFRPPAPSSTMGAPRLATCFGITGVLVLALGFAFRFLIMPAAVHRLAHDLGDSNLVIPNDTSSPRYKAFQGSAGQPPRYWKFYVRGSRCRRGELPPSTRSPAGACGGSAPMAGRSQRIFALTRPLGRCVSSTISPTPTKLLTAVGLPSSSTGRTPTWRPWTGTTWSSPRTSRPCPSRSSSSSTLCRPCR